MWTEDTGNYLNILFISYGTKIGLSSISLLKFKQRFQGYPTVGATRLSQFNLVCILSIWFVPFIVQSPWWQKTIHSLPSTRSFLAIFVPCEFCCGYQECYHSQWSWLTMPHLCGLGIHHLYQIIGKLIQCTEWKIWVQSKTK